MACVYVLENKINGKKYVGQTIQSFERRIKRNFDTDMLISRALKKYGLENFKTQVTYLPEYLLDHFEIKMIKELNSLYPNGYNLETGGSKNKVVSESTRKKMGILKKGNMNAAKRIICLNTKVSYDCAARLGNKLKKHICSVCKGKRKGAGRDENGNKLVWAYYEDYLKMTEDEIQKKIISANHNREYTKEEIIKIRDRNRKLWENEEFKKKFYARMTGENNPSKREDVKEKLRKAKTGFKLSKEAKEKIGKASRGRVKSKETIDKWRESRKTYIMSDETKRKIAESNKGKKMTDESKLKMSISAKNKPPISEETRKKLSEKTKAYWERRHNI